ncbi:MAG: LacI family DNA-binding transcriptional regulator [Rhizobiaceae bacterium]|nr:LacI family DNA-binding transcriptional regulator [Rhizobiaceae bacterium]MCV0407415.1 LacI family DNA-binding transcriptional regulator [Rhizobiaceae bacterium]
MSELLPPQPVRTRRQHGAVRIEDVARAAGVSAITVSRALNKPDSVAEETRKLVWAAVDELGYIPNRLAGGLASSRTRTVAVVIPTITNSIFADKIQGMSDVFGAADYQLILANSGYSLGREADLVAALLAQRPSAIVLTGVTHEERAARMLGRAGVPVVETWNLRPSPIDMLVGFSNAEAAFAMVAHLHHCGYRRIGFVSAPVADNDRAADRLAGYRRAVAEFDLADRPGLAREAHFTLANGAAAFREILSAHPDVEAIFFANDVLAAGGALEARRRGMRIPADIGIAGFDDVDLAQEFVPALTTVRIPRYEIGATAARMILARLDDPETDAPPVADLGFEVVQRQSTRPAPSP